MTLHPTENATALLADFLPSGGDREPGHVSQPLPEAGRAVVKIYTLGTFAIVCGQQPVVFSGKLPRRPLALLKALIAFGPRPATEERLAEALWPNADGDAATQALATTLHRLRRLVGAHAVKRQGGRLVLNPLHVWVDAAALEHTLAKLDAACHTKNAGTLAAFVQCVLDLYRGAFLEDEPDAPWLLSKREHLRTRFLHTLESAARLLVLHDPEQAIVCYHKALEIEPLAEGLYRGLMHCHLATNQKAGALATYGRCRRVLAAQLGLNPSPDTEELARLAHAI